MTEAEAINGIRRSAKQRKRAYDARRTATAELKRYCREAQAARVPITRIAREAGLSRQGVYDLLGQPPSPRS